MLFGMLNFAPYYWNVEQNIPVIFCTAFYTSDILYLLNAVSLIMWSYLTQMVVENIKAKQRAVDIFERQKREKCWFYPN